MPLPDGRGSDVLVVTVQVVGVGPGASDLLTVRAATLLQQADVVAGFGAALEVVRGYVRGEALAMDYRNQSDVLAEVGRRAAAGARCVVCAYGDPDFSAGELVARVRAACGDVEVVPGISSLQAACARLGLALEGVICFTLHRRDGLEESWEELLAALGAGRRTVVALPRPWDLMPPQVAQRLLAAGLDPGRRVVLAEQLTLPGERVTHLTLSELAAREPGTDLALLVFPPAS